MKNFLCVFCFIILGVTNYICQNISYKIGGEYLVTERHKDLGYFLTVNNKPANVSFIREQAFSIQPIDLSTLNVYSGSSHDLSSLGENKIFEKVLNLKDNLFYIYSYVDKKNKTRVVNAKLIDDNNTSVTNKNVELFASEEPKTVYLTPMTPTRYYFTTSTSKDYGLITYFLPSRKAKARENKDVVGFNLFDKSFNKKWTKEVEMPYTEQIMSIMDYHVTSKGDVYMLIRVFDENHLANYNDMMSNARYELVKIMGDSELQKKELDLGGRFFKNAKLTDDNAGNLVIVGYYGNSSDGGSGANGMYVFKFGDNAGKPNIKFFDFTTEMLKSYESLEDQKAIDKDGKLDAKLYLDDVFFHTNGDMMIVNEQYKSVVTGNSSKNYFLDIVALKMDKNGNLLWIKKIPKNQTGAGRSDLSYKYHYNNGNDYFIFVDNENNLNLRPDEVPKAHVCRMGGFLVAVKMDAQGNMKKIPILDVKKEDVSVFPIDLFKVDDNTLIGKCSKNRKRVLIKIDFK